jgi:hypothetical protein
MVCAVRLSATREQLGLTKGPKETPTQHARPMSPWMMDE